MLVKVVDGLAIYRHSRDILHLHLLENLHETASH